jgi:hypothetical protein
MLYLRNDRLLNLQSNHLRNDPAIVYTHKCTNNNTQLLLAINTVLGLADQLPRQRLSLETILVSIHLRWSPIKEKVGLSLRLIVIPLGRVQP